jgi:hypothetical protein
MTSEERRQRILELFRGLSEQERNEMLAHVRGDYGPVTTGLVLAPLDPGGCLVLTERTS